MLRFLTPRLPPRTIASHLTTIPLDNGCSQLIFNEPTPTTADSPSQVSPYFVTNHLPPAPSPPEDPNTPNSSLCPPFHIHLKEDETFHVLSGTAKFLLLDQKQDHISAEGMTTRIVSATNTITIPQGQIHTFRNASTSDPLIIQFGFSPPTSWSPHTMSSMSNDDSLRNVNTEKDHLHAKMYRFFRNTQLYRSDCASHNLPRAMSQVLLFNYYADVALVPPFLVNLHRRYPILRKAIERFIAPVLGRLMDFFGGVVLGRWMFRYRGSYDEYFLPRSTITKDNKQKMLKVDDLVCQAWRDHNFDGQSEDWRK